MAMRIWAAFALILAGLSAGAHAQMGDERIIAAREAVQKGDRATLERLAVEREPHVLDPYVRYWLLVNKLARPEPAPVGEITEFLLREADSMLAERLRGDWLRRLAREEAWHDYLRLFPDLVAPEAELRCQHWLARLRTGDGAVAAEVSRRWMELTDNHAACEPVFRALAENGQLTADQLWWRFRRQVDSRSAAGARATLGWLPVAQRADASEFDRLLKAPDKYLDRLAPGAVASRAGRELAMAALVRISREGDALAAWVRLQRLGDALGNEERQVVLAALGHHGALSRVPQAVEWFRAAGSIPLSAEQRAWRVRAALRAEDWRQVQAWIEAMPEAERGQPEWVFWLGRAHAGQGRRSEAEAQYARIAEDPHFYGMLAAEELGRPFMPPSRNGVLTPADTDRAESDPGLRRALALYRLDMRIEGQREWNWSLRGQDDGFLLAAAMLALRHDIYDRAINTAERTDPRANFELRFLTPYRQIIEPQVRDQGLDLAWVYGLMRQESRFIAPARSSAGAQGLMQVMPATGRWVANKIGLSPYHPRMLTEPDTNVLLGTSYMRLILEGLDNHPVLASAGYNAGPGRARRWREDRPLEGAIYAETIPFDETRDYVKKVMANAVIYAAMFEGRPQSLKARLGTIAPSTGADR